MINVKLNPNGKIIPLRQAKQQLDALSDPEMTPAPWQIISLSIQSIYIVSFYPVSKCSCGVVIFMLGTGRILQTIKKNDLENN